MYHIFKITNLINNKFYIYYSRRDIMKFRCPGVSRDIRNIGLDNFKFETLSEHPTKKSATGAFAKIDVPSLILLYPSYNKNKSSKGTAVERDPERVSGAWVFHGTRVPVAAL